MNLLEELKQYKQKYYTNQLLKGILIAFAMCLSVYMSLNFLEYIGRFNSWIRAIFFYGFISMFTFVSISWIILPLLKLLHINKQISDEEAAQQIGQYFPNIDDKLVNTLQLQAISSDSSVLLRASIAQKTKELSVVKFTDAIHYEENKKYLRFIFIPLFLFLLIFFIFPSLFKEIFSKSSERIIRYNETFAEPAPFTFHIQNKSLSSFKNDDFTLKLNMKGRTIPTEAYIQIGQRKYKMVKEQDGSFSYLLPKVQKNTKFEFEAAGFGSNGYELKVVERPSLLAFAAKLTYPSYLGKSNETWNNIGNLVVPEGTKIEWEFNTQATEKLSLLFGENKEEVKVDNKSGQKFSYTRFAKTSENYEINLNNEYAKNKEEIKYSLSVVPDKYPQINMQGYADTLTFLSLSVGGNINDDYGISGLKLFYRVKKEGKFGSYQSVNLTFSPEQTLQNFVHQLDLASLELKQGDEVEYFSQVWDNDGVNGAKSAKTYINSFKVPDAADFEKQMDSNISKTESQIDKTLKKAKQLQNDLQKLEDKLKTKENLDYQDKKQAEELLKKREELSEEVKKLQEQAEKLKEQQERFQEQSPELAEKMEQLKQLMEQLLDPETKKLYEELKKLLEKNKDNENVLQKLKEIKEKEQNMEKELERTLEMFKQMQFDQKMEQTAEKLKDLAEKQEKLAEKTENAEKNDKNQTEEEKNAENEKLKEEQKDLNEKFEEAKKEIDELEKMDKELENPNGMEQKSKELEKDEKEVSDEQKKSSDELQKDQKDKASKAQKKAAKKMKDMAEKMDAMDIDMGGDKEEENIEDLRAILENLLQLSFDQEALMKEFRGVNLSDPRFVKLAQEQLKLKDDAKIVEDSLKKKKKRAFQIQSFVT
ncbi:MAG: ATPase, partial [Bacteroidetes bacterium]